MSKYIDKVDVKMNIRETEMNILEILWKEGPLPASELYKILEDSIGWERSTTYTVLKKCIEKNFIERKDPGFICIPIIEKSSVQKAKIADIISVFFNNSKPNFLNTFLSDETLTEEEVKELKDYVNRLK